jgi:hypothetical protein
MKLIKLFLIFAFARNLNANYMQEFCNTCQNKELCKEKWNYCQKFSFDQCNYNNLDARNKCAWEWMQTNDPVCCCIPIEGFDKQCEI